MSDRGRRWLRAGRIGSPHGLDGSFHVRDPRPELLEHGAKVVVGGRTLAITRRAGTDREVIVRLESHSDRGAAGGLRGQEMFVARADAPALEDDEWWAEELEGCAVLDREVMVGTVRRLLALPSCEVLEVERDGDDDLLVPLVSDAVRSVDVDGRTIEIDLEFLGER